MSKFDISSRNGRIRAESDDCENITLYLWDTPGFSAVRAQHVVTMKLSDLRQIIAHFEWLQDGEKPSERTEQESHTGLKLELDTELIAKQVARHVARQIAKDIRLSSGIRK